MGVVLPAERDVGIVDVNDSVVGDGYPVRVPGQILQHMFRPAKRWLGINHPVFTKQGAQECGEPLLGRQRQAGSVKVQFLLAKGSLQTSNELAAKDTADLHRQKEAGS